MSITYICAQCGGKFDTVPAVDEAAVAEFKRLWPNEDISIAAVVCEECFKRLRSLHGDDD